MGPNSTRTLYLSVGMAVFAMFLIYSYSQERKAEYDKKFGATQRVVIASKDILEMATIDESMLELTDIPKEYIQPGALNAPEEALDLVAAAPIKKGEQVMITKLLTPGPSTGLAHQIAPERRAITLPVDEVRGVAKLVRPGDRVDIITALEAQKGGISGSKIEVKTLMQDVPVLATGVNVTNNIPRVLEGGSDGNKGYFKRLSGDTSFGSITLEVNPKEAQDLILLLATNPGSVFLSLRNPSDRNVPTLGASNTQALLGRPDLLMSDVPRQPAAVVAAPVMIPPPVQRPAATAPARKKRGPYVEIR